MTAIAMIFSYDSEARGRGHAEDLARHSSMFAESL